MGDFGNPRRLAEMSVIGCILLYPDGREDVFRLLLPEMFASEELRDIYAAALALHEEGSPVDAVLITGRLGDTCKQLLAECADVTPSLGSALRYAEIVRENWRLRIFGEQLFGLAYQCEDRGSTMKDLIPAAETVLEFQREIEKGIREDSARVLKECLAEYVVKLGSPPDALKTGYGLLDYLTGGLQRKGLYVLAARPGKGKTDFALNLALRMSRTYRVNYNTMEMPREQCTQRLVSNVTRINEANMRDRKLTQKDYANIAVATEAICQASLVLDEKVRVTAAEVKGRILRYRPDLIILDSLQLMDKKRSGRQQEHEAVADTTHMLKELAVTYNVTILLLVQETREADKGGPPTMSGLYGGSAVEQDADAVLFIRNEAVGNRIISGDDFIESKVHIVKNRHGGEGVCDFQYQPQYHRFIAKDFNRSDGYTDVDMPDAPL